MNLPDSKLKTQLYGLLNSAGNEYAALLKETDAWFNRQMDRVTGWYKRQSQLVALVISALIVLSLGIDSVRIAAWLGSDQQMRATIAGQIVKSLPTPPPGNGGQIAPFSPDYENQLVAAIDNASFLSVFIAGPIWATECSATHFFGLVITFLALTLGAPFWFDVLQRVANMRLTGPKPDGS